MIPSRLCEAFDIEFPLIQAGMGGIAGVDLASAVSEAGALGVLGLFRMRPTPIRSLVLATSARTERAFGVNLIPELMTHGEIADQIEAVLQVARPNVFFVFYGMPDREASERLVRAGRKFLVKTGDVDSLSLAESLGATAIVLQGIEAGGHLLGEKPLAALVLEARDRGCHLPIVAAGGIGTGRDFRNLVDLGAEGCMCGTLFAATLESRAHLQYKTRLVEGHAGDTIITDAYRIGWPNRRHRVLRTSVTDQRGTPAPANFIATTGIEGRRHPIPRYSAFAPDEQTQGSIAEMAMYAGTSVDAVHEIISARDCIERFVAQYTHPTASIP